MLLIRLIQCKPQCAPLGYTHTHKCTLFNKHLWAIKEMINAMTKTRSSPVLRGWRWWGPQAKEGEVATNTGLSWCRIRLARWIWWTWVGRQVKVLAGKWDCEMRCHAISRCILQHCSWYLGRYNNQQTHTVAVPKTTSFWPTRDILHYETNYR